MGAQTIIEMEGKKTRIYNLKVKKISITNSGWFLKCIETNRLVTFHRIIWFVSFLFFFFGKEFFDVLRGRKKVCSERFFFWLFVLVCRWKQQSFCHTTEGKILNLTLTITTLNYIKHQFEFLYQFLILSKIYLVEVWALWVSGLFSMVFWKIQICIYHRNCNL